MFACKINANTLIKVVDLSKLFPVLDWVLYHPLLWKDCTKNPFKQSVSNSGCFCRIPDCCSVVKCTYTVHVTNNTGFVLDFVCKIPGVFKEFSRTRNRVFKESL